jgi:signal transduction histidine kinase
VRGLAFLGRLWPRSLKGQMLLAVALALLLAQAASAVLIYRAQTGQREAALLHTAAFRLLRAARDDSALPDAPEVSRGGRRSFWLERSATSPVSAGDQRDSHAESELREILVDQDVIAGEVVVLRRRVEADAAAKRRLAARALRPHAHRGPDPDWVLLAAVQIAEGRWLVARVLIPPGERMIVATLIGQTLLIYAVLVGAIAFIVRRITRPLASLTGRTARFAETRDAAAQIAPEGPDDVRDLILAHNAMELRIATLLDEKDVMLGAIGHDLKTPLAALRVRIESVEDPAERSRMAATIDDIARSLDDILSLARAGRVREPREVTDLSALIAALVEEYEDMGQRVVLTDAPRLTLAVRATWLRSAIRNLIDNALRYGGEARVSLARQGEQTVIAVADDGPGIPEHDMARMLEPFTRGEPSRNSGTGGAGLGLALAKAIAEQHGGRLVIANRVAADGSIEGLSAELCLPPA